MPFHQKKTREIHHQCSLKQNDQRYHSIALDIINLFPLQILQGGMVRHLHLPSEVILAEVISAKVILARVTLSKVIPAYGWTSLGVLVMSLSHQSH